MRCTKPVRIIKNQSTSAGVLVPCGKCHACRKQKAQEWSLRILHELEEFNDSIFVTLTYMDSHLPPSGSLRRQDLQKFYKRLRKNIQSDSLDLPIKYFACGEYGSKNNRPHYHSIIFGLSLGDDHKRLIMDNWTFCDWDNPVIKKESFGLAEPASIRYVSQYIDKKITGEAGFIEYDLSGREAPFRLSSQGIGKRYADRNIDNLQENLSFRHGGIEHQLPRYYLNRIGMDGKKMGTIAKEKDCEIVEHYTGIYASSDDFYQFATVEEVLTYDTLLKNAKRQHEANLEAKVKLRKSIL